MMYEQPQQSGRSLEMGQTESNPMGVVGFILSLTVCLSPIGLIVSLLALTKRPKGFAVAGVIIGLLASLVLGGLIYAGRSAYPLFKAGTELALDYKQVSTDVADYQAANNGTLPVDLAAAGVTGDALVDPWGQAYQLRVLPDGSDWRLESPGIDMQWGTKDDVSLKSGMTDNQMGEEIGKMFQAHYNPNYQPPTPAPAPAPAPSEAPAETPTEEPAPSGSTP